MEEVKLVEIYEKDYGGQELDFSYLSPCYYDVELGPGDFSLELVLKFWDQPREISFTSQLFSSHYQDIRAYRLDQEGETLGYLELAQEVGNRRMRISNILVLKPYRRQGLASLLMARAKSLARTWGARQLVVETQSSNYPAISFYRKEGFVFTGIDLSYYSNYDLEGQRVRLEMVYNLRREECLHILR